MLQADKNKSYLIGAAIGAVVGKQIGWGYLKGALAGAAAAYLYPMLTQGSVGRAAPANSPAGSGDI